MSHQAYRDVIVSNNPALFQSGLSNQLAISQVGIFLYDPKKERIALATPRYSEHRTIQIILGTPEVPTNLLGAVADETKKTKPIKGKKIIDWTGRAAERGQNQIVTLGYDGVDETKTISAKCEQTKTIFVKLSGGPIDEIFHTEGRGLVRQYNIFSGCCDDCGDDCANVSAEAMADDLIEQINTDPILNLGTRGQNKLIKVSKLTENGGPAPSSTCLEYLLTVCDNNDNVSLGLVQSQYPGQTIIRKDRVGSNSIYQLIQASGDPAPDPYSNEGLVLISDCGPCPSGAGYISVGDGFAYKVKRDDAGDAGALTTVNSDYGITGDEVGIRVIYQFGQSTYVLVSDTELTVVGSDSIEFLGETRNSCVLQTPTEIDWEVGDTLDKFSRVYRITLRDSVCGTSRLEDLQEAYPDLVISQADSGDCTGLYETTIESDCIPQGCAQDAITFVAPEAFEGIEWTPVITAGDETVVGVQFETNYVDRIADECTYDYWKFNNEPLIIEVSQHSQDYNDKPTICTTEWPVTEVQAPKIAIGVGSQVRELEIFFKGYDRKHRDITNPIVRQYQDAISTTDPNVYYDQYTLTFEFDYNQGWFSEKETDTYKVEFYFPEGQGKEFEAAINGYVASVGIDLPPVYL